MKITGILLMLACFLPGLFAAPLETNEPQGIVKIQETLVTREYIIPYDIIEGATVQSFLAEQGIPNPPGKFFFDIAKEGNKVRLKIRTTADIHDLLQRLVEALDGITPEPVAKSGMEIKFERERAHELKKVKEIHRKLEETLLQKVEFRNETLEKVNEQIARIAGVPLFVIRYPEQSLESGRETPKLSFTLTNASAKELLSYALQLSGYRCSIEPEAILFLPVTTLKGCSGTLKEYRLPKKAAIQLLEKTGLESDMDGIVAISSANLDPELSIPFKDCLEPLGIVFAPGRSARYFPAKGERLLVRLDEDQIDRVDAIVDDLTLPEGTPKISLVDRRCERLFEPGWNRRLTLDKKRLEEVEVRDATLQQIIKVAEETFCTPIFVIDPATASFHPGHGRLEEAMGNRVTLSLTHVSAMEFLRTLAALLDAKLIVSAEGILFVRFDPQGEEREDTPQLAPAGEISKGTKQHTSPEWRTPARRSSFQGIPSFNNIENYFFAPLRLFSPFAGKALD